MSLGNLCLWPELNISNSRLGAPRQWYSPTDENDRRGSVRHRRIRLCISHSDCMLIKLECPTSKQCNESGLNCRYLNLYIRLKLIELAVKLYQEYGNDMNCPIFFTTSKCERPNRLLKDASQSESVWFLFIYLSLSAKKSCLQFAYSISVKSYKTFSKQD